MAKANALADLASGTSVGDLQAAKDARNESAYMGDNSGVCSQSPLPIIFLPALWLLLLLQLLQLLLLQLLLVCYPLQATIGGIACARPTQHLLPSVACVFSLRRAAADISCSFGLYGLAQGSGWVAGKDPNGVPFWTNAKTGEVSLEDPTGREKAVEEMSFDERRAHDAKQAFMQKNKGNRKQNKGTGGGRGGRRR